MSFKTILVYLESESQARHILKAAVRLADKHKSHLIGTYVAHPLEPYVTRTLDAVDSTEILKIRMEDEIRYAEQLEKLFTAATRAQNFTAEWRFDKSLLYTVVAGVMEQARSVDVLLVSAKQKNSGFRFAHEHTAHIITNCSRPTIVIPEAYQDTSFGDSVFAAWDGSRESSRAIFDALPLLKMADNVWLHRVKSLYEYKQHGNEVTRNLADTLARHGVKVETSDSESSARLVGQEILNCVQDRGADSIVMGAYGHSRMHGFLLGCATRLVLENSSVPLVMSH